MYTIFLIVTILFSVFIWRYNKRIEKENKEKSFNELIEFIAKDNIDFFDLNDIEYILNKIYRKYPNDEFECFQCYIIGYNLNENTLVSRGRLMSFALRWRDSKEPGEL